MNPINTDSFTTLLQSTRLSKSAKNLIQYNFIEDFSDNDWSHTELLAFPVKNKNKGLLLLEVQETHMLIPYELSPIKSTRATGRTKPVLCDFCFTQQSSTSASRIWFSKPKDTKAKVSHLCCYDLKCSQHVRALTNAGLRSRAQVSEDISEEDRIFRLKQNLAKLRIYC